MKKELQGTRLDYVQGSLDETNVKKDAIDQFQVWLSEYHQVADPDFNAFTLSTVDANGRPSARIVLLKGLDQRGFEFYTNYQSSKAQQMEANPNVALTFYWPQLERQVRVEGRVKKLTEGESEEYFHSRPLKSKLGAWVSTQSQVIESRKVLEDGMKHYEEKFGEGVPRPPHWGGYRVIPEVIEFWQGRQSRLHDRIVYTREGGKWKIERLAP